MQEKVSARGSASAWGLTDAVESTLPVEKSEGLNIPINEYKLACVSDLDCYIKF